MKRLSVGAFALAMALCTSAHAQSDSPGTTPDQQAAADANAAAIAKANADKAVADAQTAAANARKAAYDADTAASQSQTAAQTAKNGTVAGSSFATGTVQIGDAGPQSEAMLLVAKAIDEASAKSAMELKSTLDTDKSRRVLVVTDASTIATVHYVIFDTQVGRLITSMKTVHADYQTLVQKPLPARPAAKPEKGGQAPANAGGTRFAEFLAAAPLVDAGLTAASKLGSYFLTDYKYGAVQVTAGPQLYAASLVNQLGPTTYKLISPESLMLDQTGLQSRLEELDKVVNQAVKDHSEAVAKAADLTSRAAKEDKNADALKAAALAYTASATASQALIDAANTFMSSVFASGADKAAPVGQIIFEQNLSALLNDKATKTLVLLVTGTPSAAYYTEKNLWTFFGGIPIYTMGGTTITIKLYDPTTGQVHFWNTVATHGGYYSVRDVANAVSRKKKP